VRGTCNPYGVSGGALPPAPPSCGGSRIRTRETHHPGGVIALAPHRPRTTARTRTTASNRTTACPMRRPVLAVARRGLTASWRTSLTTIEPTDASAVLSWPARLANGCNRQHPGRQPMPLLMTSLEPHRSRSGHGGRKWLITTSKWLVQMHKPDSRVLAKTKGYTTGI
jgi:hypothetical protein